MSAESQEKKRMRIWRMAIWRQESLGGVNLFPELRYVETKTICVCG